MTTSTYVDHAAHSDGGDGVTSGQVRKTLYRAAEEIEARGWVRGATDTFRLINGAVDPALGIDPGPYMDGADVLARYISPIVAPTLSRTKVITDFNDQWLESGEEAAALLRAAADSEAAA